MAALEKFGKIKKDKNVKIKIYKKFLINISKVKLHFFIKIKYLLKYLLEYVLIKKICHSDKYF